MTTLLDVLLDAFRNTVDYKLKRHLALAVRRAIVIEHQILLSKRQAVIQETKEALKPVDPHSHLTNDEKSLIWENLKIEAIKSVRSRLKIGLKEAKDLTTSYLENIVKMYKGNHQ
jgi:ribosomal protein L7/L12